MEGIGGCPINRSYFCSLLNCITYLISTFFGERPRKIDLSLLYFDFVLANYSNKIRGLEFFYGHIIRGGGGRRKKSNYVVSTWSASRLYICSFSVLTVCEVCPFVPLETGMRPPPRCTHHRRGRRFGLLWVDISSMTYIKKAPS